MQKEGHSENGRARPPSSAKSRDVPPPRLGLCLLSLLGTQRGDEILGQKAKLLPRFDLFREALLVRMK